MFVSNLRHEGIHLGICLFGTYAGFQPSDTFYEMRTSIRWIAFEYERPPHIDAFSVRQRVIDVPRMLCSRRHHSNHGIGLHVQRDLASDDIRRTLKSRAPQPIAQNDLLPISGNLILLIELSPYLRREAHEMKVSGSNSESREPFGLTGA